MPLTLRDIFVEKYGVYEIPPGTPAIPWSPEAFVQKIREFVLKCRALPQIRTKIAGGRRLEYNGTLAIYLVPYGGTDECQTVVFYNVPEDLWVYMDQSDGEWRDLYRRFVIELYGRLTDTDYEVLRARPWEL